MATISNPIAIWGTGGHAISILETVLANGIRDAVFIGDQSSSTDFEGFPVVPFSDLSDEAENYGFVIAVGDNSSRQRISNEIAKTNPSLDFVTLIHPSTIVSSSAAIGAGSVILQGAILGAKVRVANHCIVNTGSCLDHESTLGDFASVAPRAVTGGRVSIGERSAIGIGATIRHGIEIGSDTVVGSASYVHTALPSNVVAYGTPARVIRERNGDDPYLS